MIFIDHVNTVLSKLREDPITSIQTDWTTAGFKAQVAVQRAVKRIWNAKQWMFKARKHVFPTVISQMEYNLPKYVGETYKVLSSNDPYTLANLPEDLFDKRVPNPADSGDPTYFMLFEMSGSEANPASGTAVDIVSSSSADITQTITIKGIVNDVLTSEDVDLNTTDGTITVTTTNLFSKVFTVTLSAACAGTVTVSVSSVTIKTIAAGLLTGTVAESSSNHRTGTVITIHSTEADTATVMVKGIVYDSAHGTSEIDSELIVLNGENDVSGSKTFEKIHAVTKSAETAGVVIVKAGATQIATLAPQEKVCRYKKIRLFPIPSSRGVITVKHFAAPPTLSLAYEDTEIPERWDGVVDQYAIALALQSKGQDQLNEFTTQMQLAQAMLDEMSLEERISSEEVVIPLKWGDTDNINSLCLPNGYGITSD